MKLLSKVSLSIFALFIVVEVLLRLTYNRRLDYWTQFQYQPDTTVGYKYVPNSKGTFKNFAFSRNYSLNSLGYPGPEYKMSKDSSMFRIIVVGTSDDTGLNTDGPESYVSIANKLFKENNQNIEILNFSIDGRDKTLENIKIIQNECIKYKPDLILLRNEFPIVDKFRMRETYRGVVINYANPITNIDSAKEFIDTAVLRRDFQKTALDYSYIYRGITKYAIEHQKDSEFMKSFVKVMYPEMKVVKGYVRNLLDWSISKDKNKYKPVELGEDESIKILKDLTRELAEQKTKLLLFDTYKTSKNECDKLFSQNNINYLAINLERKAHYSFGDLDGHSSQKGHEAIALALYEKLQPFILAPQKIMSARSPK